MKITHWPLLFLLLAGPVLFGQSDPQPTLQWGPTYRSPGNSTLEKVIGFTPNDIFFLRQKNSTAFSRNEKIYLERFSRDLKLKHSEEIVLKYEKKEVVLEDVLFLNNQLYLLTSYANVWQEKIYLFLQKLSDRQMRPTGSVKKIAEVPLTRNHYGKAFDFALSSDSSKVLIYNQIPSAAKQPERFALHVFNQNMELEWEREVLLPYPDEQLAIREYRIDKEGKVYLLGALYEAGRRNRQLPTRFLVLEYQGDSQPPSEWSIRLEGQFITDLTFRIAHNGDLICSGFYSERDAESAKGVCYFRLDARTKQVVTQTWQPFDFEFRASDLSNRGRERAMEAEITGDNQRGAELFRFNLDHLILRTDGGALLVGEQYFVQERYRRFWDGTLQIYYVYYYNDIVVVNIQPSGAIEWAVRLPKEQISIDDGGYFSSYVMANVRDRIYFLYNDNSRNYEAVQRPNQLFSFSGSQHVLAIAEVRRDGSYDVSPLKHDVSVMARPKASRQIGSRLMVLVGERGKNQSLGNLIFPAQ
jgi:hypothetical protein